MTIRIKPSPTADTRSCDYASVTEEQLLASSRDHRVDVWKAMTFLKGKLAAAGYHHDDDKLTGIKEFHRDFLTGFERTDWYDGHRRDNRHHLTAEDGVPDDVNLLDVLECVADIVTAGMARKGEVYPLELTNELLQRALANTVELLQDQIEVTE